MSFTEENITDVRKILNEGRQVSYRQIEKTLSLNVLTIRSILKDYLIVSKLCHVDQKTRHVIWCQGTLKIFDKRQSRYENNIKIGDETWLYYYNHVSK